MDQQFNAITVILVVTIALLVGYVAGRLRGSSSRRTLVPPPARPLSRNERDEVVALIAEGQTILAIRRVRELTGADLQQAHQAVKLLEQELGPRQLGT